MVVVSPSMIMLPKLYCIDWPSPFLSRSSSPDKHLVSSTPIEGSIDLAEPTINWSKKKLSDVNSITNNYIELENICSTSGKRWNFVCSVGERVASTQAMRKFLLGRDPSKVGVSISPITVLIQLNHHVGN